MFLITNFSLQHDRYLKTIVKTAKDQDGTCKFLAAGMINALLAHDPSTNWILGQTGLVNSLITILRDPLAPATVKADATLGLKNLTTFSQRNRDDVLLSKGIQDLIATLKARASPLVCKPYREEFEENWQGSALPHYAL